MPVLLDGAQGVGAVPIDVGALGCAFYAGSGQKWLCGPVGHRDAVDRARPGASAWRPLGATYMNLAEPGARRSTSPLHPDARRHDAPGAVAPRRRAAAVAAHDVLARRRLGRGPRARADARRRARRPPRASAAGPSPRATTTTLVSWEDDDPEATRDRLAAAGIVVRNLPGTPYLRASVGAWNDERDLERLLSAL